MLGVLLICSRHSALGTSDKKWVREKQQGRTKAREFLPLVPPPPPPVFLLSLTLFFRSSHTTESLEKARVLLKCLKIPPASSLLHKMVLPRAQSESAQEATLALDHNHMFYSHYILNSYILSVMRTSHPDTGFLTRMRDFVDWCTVR